MRKLKISKLLPLALLMCLSIGTANAVGIDGTDESTTAHTDYTLTLTDYVKITTTAQDALTSDGSYDEDYANLTLTNPMSTKFNVISNAKTRKVKLESSCINEGSAPGMYGFATEDGSFHIVFTNTTQGAVPGTAVTNITGGVPTVDDNPNAIAFKVTTLVQHAHGPEADPVVAAWNTDHIEYTIKNGVTDLTYTLDAKAIPETFNTQDMSGTYTAKLTMTDMGPL